MLLFFIIGTANFIGLGLYGGEEQYLAFAKQFMDPEWMPHSFTLNHPAGGNLFFQVITGFFLRYFSFEQIAFWGRIINFFLYAIPLALIFRYLKFTNIESVFLFQLFYLPHQSIWAGEWVYKNLEEKTLAYIFVFFAIYYLLKDKPLKSSLFAAFATFFHFLVGGWFFAISFIYYLVAGKKLKELFYVAGIYVIVCLPFFIYLASVYVVGNETVINGVNTSWVYANYRLHNHIGIFWDMAYFKKQHLQGILLSLVLFLICIFYFRRFKQRNIRILNTLNIIIFTEQFIFIVIAWFDKNGVLLKTYPFRTSALSALFLWLEIGLIVKHYGSFRLFHFIRRKLKWLKNKSYALGRIRYAQRANMILLGIFLIYFVFETAQTISTKNREVPPPDAAMLRLLDFARSTDKKSVFLFLDNDSNQSFIRRTNREKFVAYKFTPTKNETIYEWYDRLQWKEKLRNNITLIDSVKKLYRVDYLISGKDLKDSSLIKIHEFGNYRMYEVKDGSEP
jgi:hypothetical protein